MPRISSESNSAGLEEVRAAKGAALEVFGRLGKVTGVGITRLKGGYGLKVNVEEKLTSVAPVTVQGVPVRVEVTGGIQKRAK
jgi:hypothetical protein